MIPNNQEHIEARQQEVDEYRLKLKESLTDKEKLIMVKVEKLTAELSEANIPHIMFVSLGKHIIRYNWMFIKEYANKFTKEALEEGNYYAKCFARTMLQWAANYLGAKVQVVDDNKEVIVSVKPESE